MNTDHYTDRLSEYLDGELDARTRAEIDAHLQGCGACRAVVDDLRQVIARADSLEDGEPPRDLWPAIAARIEAEREIVLPVAAAPRTRRFSFTLPQLAAASLALILVSGGSVWMLGRAGEEPALATAPSGEVNALPAAAAPGTDSLQAQIVGMEQMLLEGQTQLDPETIAVLRRNLLIIDQALAEAGAALRSDPANPYLSRHYQNTMEKKLELLRQAGTIGRGNT